MWVYLVRDLCITYLITGHGYGRPDTIKTVLSGIPGRGNIGIPRLTPGSAVTSLHVFSVANEMAPYRFLQPYFVTIAIFSRSIDSLLIRFPLSTCSGVKIQSEFPDTRFLVIVWRDFISPTLPGAVDTMTSSHNNHPFLQSAFISPP